MISISEIVPYHRNQRPLRAPQVNRRAGYGSSYAMPFRSTILCFNWMSAFGRFLRPRHQRSTAQAGAKGEFAAMRRFRRLSEVLSP
jgi:hypothetical protein